MVPQDTAENTCKDLSRTIQLLLKLVNSDKLAGKWGILDNKDCRSVVCYLDCQDLIDGKRASVRGGSAGGYTTLCSVTAVSGAPTFFKAATSAYGGISNLLDLAKKTEKFELRYMWRLLGGSPSEIEQVYKDRSPFYRVDSTMGTPLLVSTSGLVSCSP